jgi:hypothetical protein
MEIIMDFQVIIAGNIQILKYKANFLILLLRYHLTRNYCLSFCSNKYDFFSSRATLRFNEIYIDLS